MAEQSVAARVRLRGRRGPSQPVGLPDTFEPSTCRFHQTGWTPSTCRATRHIDNSCGFWFLASAFFTHRRAAGAVRRRADRVRDLRAGALRSLWDSRPEIFRCTVFGVCSPRPGPRAPIRCEPAWVESPGVGGPVSPSHRVAISDGSCIVFVMAHTDTSDSPRESEKGHANMHASTTSTPSTPSTPSARPVAPESVKSPAPLEEWELALMRGGDVRRNRRAVTDRPVRDNTAFDIRVLEDGYGRYRSSFYYRRHLSGGVVFTGRRSDGLALHIAGTFPARPVPASVR